MGDQNNKNQQNNGYYGSGGFNNSYYGGWGQGSFNNYQNKNEPRAQGGWSTGQNKAVNDSLDSGGWGKKPQQPAGFGYGRTGYGTGGSAWGGTGGYGTGGYGTGGYGSGGFGTGGSAWGGYKTGGYGTSGYGTGGYGTGGYGTGGYGGFTAQSGFGTGYGSYGKPKPKKPNVPTYTIGLPFMSTQKERGTGKKFYTVYHINMLDMYKMYSTEEIRYWDYIYLDKIKPLQGEGQMTTQGQSNYGYGMQSGQGASKSQQEVYTEPTNWYEVPDNKWPKIMEIKEANKDQETILTNPYGELPPVPKDFESQNGNGKKGKEIVLQKQVELKQDLFNDSSDQETQLQNQTDFQFTLAFNKSNSSSRSVGNSTTQPKSLHPNQQSSFQRSEMEKSGLTPFDARTNNNFFYIPSIDPSTTVVDNLYIIDDIYLIFPFPIDIECLKPNENIEIKKFDDDNTSSEIWHNLFSIFVKVDDGILPETPSIVFIPHDLVAKYDFVSISTSDQNNYVYAKGKLVDDVSHTDENDLIVPDGADISISLTINSLDCYPVNIFYMNYPHTVTFNINQ